MTCCNLLLLALSTSGQFLPHPTCSTGDDCDCTCDDGRAGTYASPHYCSCPPSDDNADLFDPTDIPDLVDLLGDDPNPLEVYGPKWPDQVAFDGTVVCPPDFDGDDCDVPICYPECVLERLRGLF